MQLIKMWVSELSVRTDPEWKATPGKVIVPMAGIQATVQQSDQEPRVFQVLLTVTVPHLDPDIDLPLVQCPYSVEVRVAARFAFIDESKLDRTEMVRMVGFNGVATVYAFARDTVHQLTAQGEHGAFILPVLDISDIGEQLVEKVAAVTLEHVARAAQADGETE